MEQTTEETTVWRSAANRILWGIGLTGITWNFFGLNYLLPLIGVILMLLGFRALRKEQAGWNTGVCFAALRLVGFMIVLAANATIFRWKLLETAKEHRMMPGMFGNAFLVVQDAIQFRTDDTDAGHGK